MTKGVHYKIIFPHVFFLLVKFSTEINQVFIWSGGAALQLPPLGICILLPKFLMGMPMMIMRMITMMIIIMMMLIKTGDLRYDHDHDHNCNYKLDHDQSSDQDHDHVRAPAIS